MIEIYDAVFETLKKSLVFHGFKILTSYIPCIFGTKIEHGKMYKNWISEQKFKWIVNVHVPDPKSSLKELLIKTRISHSVAISF